MQFIVMDLEWNNAYSHKLKAGFNEIIEIGAVKISRELKVVDSFNEIIRPQVGKKLRGSVKKLTNLTNDDVNSGLDFDMVFSKFTEWIGEEETTFLSWGDGDIRVLVQNFTYFKELEYIPFVDCYCDLQACFHNKMNIASKNQIGLAAAGELLGIDVDEFMQHRALGDSLLTAEIFIRTFDEKILGIYLKKCDNEFYRRLFFKAKVISNIDNPIVDKSKFNHSCSYCNCLCELTDEWKFKNQYFRASYVCPVCSRKYSVGIRYKKYYDHIEIRKIEHEIIDDKEADE